MLQRFPAVPIPDSRFPIPGRSEALALVVLTAVVAALYTHSALVTDSGRDLGNAWQVASGGGIPAYGPRIYGTWSLGPAWYLLLALPLTLGGVGAAALWIGALAAAKIPLAWTFARMRYGAAAALALAAAVALPGWSTAGMLVIAHTAVVESAVWAVFAAYALDLARPRLWTPALVALLFVLALHAHPTAIVCAPLLGMLAWRVARAPQAGTRIAVALASSLLPLLPVLYAEAVHGWPQLHATRAYADEVDVAARLAHGAGVARGWIAGSAPLVGDYLLPRSAGATPALAVMLGAALVAAIGATVRAALRLRFEPAWLALWCAASVCTIALLRAQTPAYMLFVLAPLAAWWWIAAIAHGAPALLRLRWGLAAVALLLTLGVHARMQAVRADARIDLPGAALADAAAPLQSDGAVRFWLAAGDHDAIAAWACAQPGTLALHGTVATALDFGQGVAFAANCATPPTVRLGGADASAHWFALPVADARALGIGGTHDRWGYRWLQPRAVLHPARGDVPAAHARYRADDYVAQRVDPPLRLAIACMPGQWLAVGNRAPTLNLPFDVSLRDANGAPVQPALRTLAATYYPCPPAPQSWTLDVAAQHTDAVDVVQFDAMP